MPQCSYHEYDKRSSTNSVLTMNRPHISNVNGNHMALYFLDGFIEQKLQVVFQIILRGCRKLTFGFIEYVYKYPGQDIRKISKIDGKTYQIITRARWLSLPQTKRPTFGILFMNTRFRA